MKPLNVALLILSVVLAVVAVRNFARVSRYDAALAAATDSADVRAATLAAAVFTAEAREASLRDSLRASERERGILRIQRGAERAKSDSLWAAIEIFDSVMVPKQLVAAMAHSLHAEIRLLETDNKRLLDEIRQLNLMYASADSGRAALFDALAVQQSLTQAWREAVKPPLFSWRRLKLGPGCAVGVGGYACGVAVTYDL